MNVAVVLRALAERQVEYILVGGLAARIAGCPNITEDIDLLYRVEDENVRKLEQALLDLDAVARNDKRRQRFSFDHLNNFGHHLAATVAGDVDALGSINDGLTFEDILPDTEFVTVTGQRIRIIRLERLIELKRKLGRPKDLAQLPVLEATLREKAAHRKP